MTSGNYLVLALTIVNLVLLASQTLGNDVSAATQIVRAERFELVDSRGTVRCVYDESLDLAALGPVSISRASHVEPDAHGHWIADLAPVAGPQLGPFEQRSQALAAEQQWLREHWLAPSS